MKLSSPTNLLSPKSVILTSVSSCLLSNSTFSGWKIIYKTWKIIQNYKPKSSELVYPIELTLRSLWVMPWECRYLTANTICLKRNRVRDSDKQPRLVILSKSSPPCISSRTMYTVSLESNTSSVEIMHGWKKNICYFVHVRTLGTLIKYLWLTCRNAFIIIISFIIFSGSFRWFFCPFVNLLFFMIFMACLVHSFCNMNSTLKA